MTMPFFKSVTAIVYKLIVLVCFLERASLIIPLDGYKYVNTKPVKS